MSKPTRRLFPTSHDTDRCERELDRITGTATPKTVAVPLGKIVPLLIEAVASDRAWLADFTDDTVRMDSDLYEVLLAYSQLRHRAAA